MKASIEHTRVQANGIKFHVASTGLKSKPPILCLHGFPEGRMSWRLVIEALSETYCVYVVNLRGYSGQGVQGTATMFSR